MAQVVSRLGVPAYAREDCIQEGLIAAWQAEQSYDPAAGASKSTWITRKVTWAVQDAQRSADFMSRQARSDLRQVEQARERLAATGKSHPDVTAVATEAGLSVERVRACGQWRRPVYGADAEMAQVRDPATSVEEQAVAQVLAAQALTVVSEREARVLTARFVEDRSTGAVARSEAVSPSRISQITHQALRAIRRAWSAGPSTSAG